MDTIGQIGQFFSGDKGQGLLKLGELGTAGAGLVGNVMNNRERSQELDYVKKQQALTQDPVALARQVAAATQPLDRGLVQSVGNTVDANLAEKGLSQAPGIQATVLSQSLAPFEQQNQQTALALVMKQLGLPMEYAQTLLAGLPQNTNLAPLLALLQKGGTPGGGGTPNINTLAKLYASSQMPGQQPTTSSLPNTLVDTSSLPNWINPTDTGNAGDFSVPSEVYA